MNAWVRPIDRSPNRGWRSVAVQWRPRLRLAVDLFVVAYVFSLDLLDLYFKTQWIGPHDSFSFSAVARQQLQREPLKAAAAVGDRHRVSGWGSFLEACERLYPIGGDFFLHVLGENCRVGPSERNVSVPKLIIVSSLRVDSVAYASCRLLRPDRRPLVCRSSMVQRFAARYNIAEMPTLVKQIEENEATSSKVQALELDSEETSWICAPGGAAEIEVLELLRVIDGSLPLGRVVCVEGFVYEGPGHYMSSVYGCGSPNHFESAFVGVHAPMISLFQQNKAWLTSDRLSVFGFHILMRENCISLFDVVEEQRDGALTLTLTHRTRINFSSSGPLYVLVIAIDLFVVTVNVLSTAEIMGTIPWMPHDHNGALVTSSDYVDVLTRRMLRSTPFTVLTVVSQLVSWTVVLVNSVIWTWTEARWGRVRAFLSTIRFWVLVLVALNTMWNIFVFLTERHAYIFVKRAYVSMFEVLVVATTVAFIYRESLFAISDVKQALEGQRLTDTETFDGKTAFANAYPEGLEDTLMTPVAVAWTIYQPLVEIVAWSFAGAAAIAISRYLRHMATVCRRWSRHRVHPMSNVAAAPTIPLAWSHSGGIERIVPGPQSSDVSSSTPLPPRRYMRLPIEELLGVPLRARSLIRNWVAMDIEVSGDERRHRVLQSATLVDHGLLLVDGSRLRCRRGFFGTIPSWTTRTEFGDPVDTASRLSVLH